MKPEIYVGIAGVVATLVGVIVTWLVARRSVCRKRLTFTMSLERLLRRASPVLGKELKVIYRDEELAEPTLILIEITNSGNVAIEKAEVQVSLHGDGYLLPGYFVRVPAGYNKLWSIQKRDEKSVVVSLEHVNPGQVARIRFLSDQYPSSDPIVACAMPNVEFVRVTRSDTLRMAEAMALALATIRQARRIR